MPQSVKLKHNMLKILKNFEKFKLEIAVFVCGAIVMVFELVGSRIVAPYLGTSIYVWTSIIGVILGSLSAGYYLGGKMADKNANFSEFSKIIFYAAGALGAVLLLKDIILFIFQNLNLRLDVAALFSSLILFAPASILFGIVSPYAVKLKLFSLDCSGTTVGNLYAISTIGSIVGTFSAGFFLIGLFGNMNLLIMMAGITALVSILVSLENKDIAKKITFLILLLYFCIYVNLEAKKIEKQGVVDVDSQYSRILITKTEYNKEPILALTTSSREIQCAAFLNKDELVFDYLKFYRMVQYFNPEIDSALMLGGCNYSYPRDFLKSFPEASIDVVEIDPKMTELAKTYFNLQKNSKLNIIHEDARIFLNKNEKKYGAIFSDAFNSNGSIPYQLTTIETVKKEYQSLNNNGIFLANIIGSINGERSEFLRAEYATYQKVFPQVYLFPVADANDVSKVQNIILLAIKSSIMPNFNYVDGEIAEYFSHLWKGEIKTNLPALTDDFAPVDYYERNSL